MRTTRYAAAALAVLLQGCAAEVVRDPVELAAASARPRVFVSERTAEVVFDSGYSRSLPEGAEFVEHGSLRQGLVLKPTRAVIMVQGAHSHEGYPVMGADGRIVGFYLPVERAFAPLAVPVAYPLLERKQP